MADNGNRFPLKGPIINLYWFTIISVVLKSTTKLYKNNGINNTFSDFTIFRNYDIKYSMGEDYNICVYLMVREF